ncbi:MAG: 3-hydroxyacyl-ACP dehydratase FabZ [Alphaproteobacteria bacterium]
MKYVGAVNFIKNGESLTIEQSEIVKLIPHRYPFLLIDRVIDVNPGISATGIKLVSINEWYFQGHFPDHPVLPGVLIVEAMAQTAAVLVVKTLLLEGMLSNKDKGNLVYFMSIEEAKFRKPVTPGDVLNLKVQKERTRGNLWRFRGEAFVGDKKTDDAIFTAMIVDK